MIDFITSRPLWRPNHDVTIPPPPGSSYLGATYDQYVRMHLGVKKWTMTGEINGEPFSGTLSALKRNVPNRDGDPFGPWQNYQLIDFAQNEVQLYCQALPPGGIVDIYSYFGCEELVDHETDPDSFDVSAGLVFQDSLISPDAESFGWSEYEAILPNAAALFNPPFRFFGQAFSMLNDTAINTMAPEASPCPVSVVRMSAYGTDFDIYGDGTYFSNNVTTIDTSKYPGGIPDSIEVTLEASEYWTYGGRWSSTTGL